MSTAAAGEFAWIDRVARGVVNRWLWLFNGVAVLYAGLPWVAPMLREAGWTRLNSVIFALYGAACHQLPERSFFVGNSQVCYCHRCTALYSSVAIAGLLYGLLRWRWSLPGRWLILAGVPILIDGLWHMANDFLPGLALRSAASDTGSVNFWVRMVTGVLFGAAAVFWLYPRAARELQQVEHG